MAAPDNRDWKPEVRFSKSAATVADESGPSNHTALMNGVLHDGRRVTAFAVVTTGLADCALAMASMEYTPGGMKRVQSSAPLSHASMRSPICTWSTTKKPSWMDTCNTNHPFSANGVHTVYPKMESAYFPAPYWTGFAGLKLNW
jgi:hypothetical protein